ncbi:DUF397 domain-containing protein [Streptomyces sp. MS19]|uniref:DUF397 domain-containing protein n=1 Tax=Streptomyces sp. MS19 TaxID=3385972 RepID=UPI0039A33D1E
MMHACIENASTLRVRWWKASASGAQSDCVEFGVVSGAVVAVRDSKVPHGPALLFGREQVAGLVAALRSEQV